MTMRPSLREAGTVPGLIKAKPCRAALSRAGLDNAPHGAPDERMAGTGKG
jgi:hypothetical protein